MKSDIEVINTCKQILIDFEIAKDINTILNLYESLSINSVFLAESLSEIKKEYNHSYYIRKIEVSKSYLNNKNQKLSDKSAFEKAQVENEELLKDEVDREAFALRLDNFLKQINRVLDMMRSKFSYLKDEGSRTKISDVS